MTDQVHDAGLDDRLRKGGCDRLGKAVQAADDGDENVLATTVLQFVHHPQSGTIRTSRSSVMPMMPFAIAKPKNRQWRRATLLKSGSQTAG